MYSDVCVFAKTCKDCRELSFTSSYLSRLKASLTLLLDIYSIEFAGRLPTIAGEMRLVLICMEKFTGLLVAHPTSLVVALADNASLKQPTVFSFKTSCLIISNNDPCLSAGS